MSLEADELDTKIGLLIQNRISLQVIYGLKKNTMFFALYFVEIKLIRNY